jgi:NTP pyrophosphatase (non-canonical NTP hydrolase)
MNQDEVKEKLLAIEDAPLDFTVIFSGKKNKKVNGLYKPDTREIIIHNRNFQGDAAASNLLIYTAIHEYGHHLHACARGGHLSPRAHTAEFWAILHGLLEKAEERGIYKDVFSGPKAIDQRSFEELEKLTETIRKKYLTENGNLVKELGQLLLKAHDLCSAIGGRYEDYIDRVLRIPRQAANLAVRMHQYGLNPETGPDNMRFLAGIPNGEKRLAAENALLAGKSPDTVKIALRKKPDSSAGTDPRLTLEKEKIRLERTIAALTKRLEEVERELGDT